jgi:hypothetical protein
MAQSGVETEPADSPAPEQKVTFAAPGAADNEVGSKESHGGADGNERSSKDTSLCAVCEKKASKYKCPRCYLP